MAIGQLSRMAPIPAINVFTDLRPDALTEVGLQVYQHWLAFALGKEAVGGRILMHPTGRYASSISFKKLGRYHVAIIADEKIAPEAAVLEKGHGPIDMKRYLRQGGAYPMHRGRRQFTGFASVGSTGWVIPPMRAYSVAQTYADLLYAAYGGGSVFIGGGLV